MKSSLLLIDTSQLEVLPMTTPDYVEASLTLAHDGAAPVFHMVGLPDSVVFVQVMAE
jgi:hypothetical protein